MTTAIIIEDLSAEDEGQYTITSLDFSKIEYSCAEAEAEADELSSFLPTKAFTD